MPDLHGWISRQIAKAEAAAEACPPWPWTFNPDEDAVLAADDIRVVEAFALSSRQQYAVGAHIAAHDPAAVLRRCTADRIILEFHQQDSGGTACIGCGTWGDCQDWETSNINDCPTLLALALALGLTDEQRRQLHRPQPPEPDRAWGIGQPPDTSHVPAALRGPNWKAQP
ncbi:hypothetical protein GT352_28060 [Streptomyces sp. SID1046]|uniref:DUF6221 family protein n=1 Tax=Streptomyces sp. SID1046 TaxID=2690249 RepID=UPI0013687B75|nr:DUF6221 family protein [Streptomyces sp. SID1046]MYV77756.1 hypothetical protein [Streptomyces sp. SID1046]